MGQRIIFLMNVLEYFVILSLHEGSLSLSSLRKHLAFFSEKRISETLFNLNTLGLVKINTQNNTISTYNHVYEAYRLIQTGVLTDELDKSSDSSAIVNYLIKENNVTDEKVIDTLYLLKLKVREKNGKR